MVIPAAKGSGLSKAYKDIEEVEKQYRRGIITQGERSQKIIDIWTQVGDQVTDELFRTLEYNDGKKQHNPLYVMVTSGARGNRSGPRGRGAGKGGFRGKGGPSQPKGAPREVNGNVAPREPRGERREVNGNVAPRGSTRSDDEA